MSLKKIQNFVQRLPVNNNTDSKFKTPRQINEPQTLVLKYETKNSEPIQITFVRNSKAFRAETRVT